MLLSKDRVVSSLVRVLKLDSVDLATSAGHCEGVWKYLLSSRSLIASNFELTLSL